MKKNQLAIKILQKVCGISIIIFGLFFAYLFLRVIPIMIMWLKLFTLIDTFKFLLAILGELMLASISIFMLFIGLAISIDIEKL